MTVQSAFAIEIPEALLERARRGEVAAFERLYRCFEKPVYTLALRMSGDPDEAQDILQNTMLKLIDRFDEFRGDSPFWGWLRRIAVNETLMRLRHRQRLAESALPEVELPDPGTRLPPAAADAGALARALQRLPDVTRSVLWLYHGEGYTHPEIAELMGRTVSFSKSQLARGLVRLRAELGVSLPEETQHA